MEFGWKGFVKLGDISYSLYLVHFPVIATLGCWLFGILFERLSYNMAAMITFVVTTVVTLAVSAGFTKYIEPLGNAGEVYVKKLIGKNK
mgnify:CR=1 FL=1